MKPEVKFNDLMKQADAALTARRGGGGVGADKVTVVGSGGMQYVKLGGVEIPTLRRMDYEIDALVEDVKTRLEEIESRTPRVEEMHVTVSDRPDKVVIKGAVHKQFKTLLEACSVRDWQGHRKNILLKGNMGGGKSTAGKQVAEALGIDFGYIGQTEMPSNVIGSVNPVTNVYNSTAFVDAFINGGVVMLEEMDAWAPRASLVVNVPLANGYLITPDGKKHARHPDCVVIACANTWGHGATVEYVGRNRLDAAFLDRFAFKIDWLYDEELERRVARNNEVVDIVQSARYAASKYGIKIAISPRSSIDIADMVRGGFTIEQACDMNFLASADKDQRATLLQDAPFD